MAKKYKHVILAVLDGFGVNISNPESTWKHAKMPTFRELEKFYPFTTLQASGISVGLPWGEEENSEVGPLAIGAGNLLYHHLPRIITSIHNGSFFRNQAFLDAANFVKNSKGKIHLMGLFSSGSVHSYIDHLYALLDFCDQKKLERVYLHLFTDGKDAPTKEAALFLRQLEERLTIRYPFAKIATLSGRHFAMDRDENWDRVEKIYRCLTAGTCPIFKNAADYVESAYTKGVSDEYVEPARSAESKIESGDAVVFYNFREDSVRELTSAFISDSFAGFARDKIGDLFFVTMTEYDKRFPAAVAFSPLDVSQPLAKLISDAGLKQLHVAETEKYAHVTYFFNGGRAASYQGEERILIPSPKSARFDETPEMSAAKITDTILENVFKYDFVLVNFANGDMVGHTGNFDATVKAIEALDLAIGKLVNKTLEAGGALIVTADHGNAEEKIYSASGERRTKHTANPVPFFIITQDLKNETPRSESEIFLRYTETKGVLTDIAPTILALMGIKKSHDMTGVDLLPKII